MDIKDKISLLPHSPGVYRYYDDRGDVIYIGKAKDLHKRVAQYFVSPDKLSRKTAILVSKIADIQYSVVETESDALLLENNLIKEFKPRYNILLKDSKTYPWICITTNELYPRIYITRTVDRGRGQYFGPYSSAHHAKSLLSLITELYPIRSCRLNITPASIQKKNQRPCLDYHIHKCLGCCIGEISPQTYNSYINESIKLLKGEGRELISNYKALMLEESSNLNFEKAQMYKNRIDLLNNHYSKSIIQSVNIDDLDVFSLIIDDSEAFGNFMRYRGGAIITSFNLGFKLNIEEDKEDVLSTFIAEIESKFGKLSHEVLVPFMPSVQIDNVEFKIPLRGDKLSILDLSMKNAKEMRFNLLKQREHLNPDKYYNKVLEELQHILGMDALPVHIECFDNSNIQGTNPVASCVVFRNGKPSKKDYRKFKVKTVVGANDFASMYEIVHRRYSRLLQESPDDIPQLVVIDGGKGQLGFAYRAIKELGLHTKLSIIGLAKRLEEVIRIDDPYPLFIDRNSQALKVLQHIRDEAHRFGITFHRSLRSKAQIESALSKIKGVGSKTEQRLLMHYGSVAQISKLTEDELSKFLNNKSLANRILEQLKSFK